MTIKETTQQELSGHMVGVSNIWERKLPGADGVVEQRLSANLSIMEKETRQERDSKVLVGAEVTLGKSTWRVTNIERGASARGSLTLVEVAR